VLSKLHIPDIIFDLKADCGRIDIAFKVYSMQCTMSWEISSNFRQVRRVNREDERKQRKKSPNSG
jgi:hypothetical protein